MPVYISIKEKLYRSLWLPSCGGLKKSPVCLFVLVCLVFLVLIMLLFCLFVLNKQKMSEHYLINLFEITSDRPEKIDMYPLVYKIQIQ